MKRLTVLMCIFVFINISHAGRAAKLLQKFSKKYYSLQSERVKGIKFSVKKTRDGELILNGKDRLVRAKDDLQTFPDSFLFFKAFAISADYKLNVNYLKKTIVIKGKYKHAGRKENEVKLFFNRNGYLRQCVSLSPTGTKIATFKFSKKKWSKKRLVLDEVNTTIIGSGFKRDSIYQLKYNVFSGKGVLSNVRVKSTYKLGYGSDSLRSRKVNEEIEIIKIRLMQGAVT